MRARVILLSVGLLGVGCTASRLPERRPADFAFGYDQLSGRWPESYSLSCTTKECVLSHRKGAEVEKLKKEPTAAQLDSVYQAFRDNRFDRIRLETHGVIYDGGGIAISCFAADRSYNLGPSATESVAEADRPRFDAVYSAIGAVIGPLFGIGPGNPTP